VYITNFQQNVRIIVQENNKYDIAVYQRCYSEYIFSLTECMGFLSDLCKICKFHIIQEIFEIHECIGFNDCRVMID